MKEHIFGIDRVKLKNIPIDRINIKKLKEKGFVVIQEDDKSFRILKDNITGEEVGINYIKVSKQQDNTLRINELKIARGKIPGVHILPLVDYEHLDVNLPMQISRQGINDKNINNLKDLMEALNLIKWELEGLGFGKVNLINSELKEIEINCNIPINEEFEKYERIIEYLYNLLPKTLKNYNKHKKQGQFTGISVSNTQQEIKIYDKQRQVKEKTGIEIERKLRLEYTFKSEDKIKSIFGDNKLIAVIEDDFQKLQEVMRELVFNDLVNRAYKDIDSQLKQAARELKRYKGRGGATAGQEYIYDYELLDIEILLAGLKEIDKSGNFTRDARKEIERAVEGKQIKLFGNINKLNEILEGLGIGKMNIKLTPTIEKELEKYY